MLTKKWRCSRFFPPKNTQLLIRIAISNLTLNQTIKPQLPIQWSTIGRVQTSQSFAWNCLAQVFLTDVLRYFWHKYSLQTFFDDNSTMQKTKPEAPMHGTFIKVRESPVSTYSTTPRTNVSLQDLLSSFEVDVIEPYKSSKESGKFSSGNESGKSSKSSTKSSKSSSKCSDTDRVMLENELDRRLVAGGFFPDTIDELQAEDLCIGRVERSIGKAGRMRLVFSDYFASEVLSKRYLNLAVTA